MKFNVGDKVKVVRGNVYAMVGNFLNGRFGEILKVDTSDTKLPYLVGECDFCLPYWCAEDMLELVEEEKKEEKKEKPKSVTFRIKAIKDDKPLLTKGKVYEFIDGYTIFDSGMKSNEYKDFKHFIKMNDDWEDFVIELKTLTEGDEVRVTNNKSSYFRYKSWEHLGKYVENFVMEGRPSKHKIYKVILFGEHSDDYSNRTLALIQDQDTTQVFIMGVEDLELIKKCEEDEGK